MKEIILITGHSGHLGRNFVKQFKDRYYFIGITKEKTGLIDEEIIYDFGGKNKIKMPEKVDYVIHFASMTDVNECEENKEKSLIVNVGGTLNLLEESKKLKIKKFIYISTGSVYNPSDNFHKEEEILKPADFYSVTKLMAEKLCGYYSKYFKTIVVRPFFPYGPDTKPNRLIDLLINRIIHKKPIILNENSKPKINPMFVYDFNTALEKIMIADNSEVEDVYNFAGEETRSIEEISKEMGEILNIKPIFEKSQNTSPNFLGDISKLKRIYTFKHPLKEGLPETIRIINGPS